MKPLCKTCKYENKEYCEYWEEESDKYTTHCSAYETKSELLIIPEILKLIDKMRIGDWEKGINVKLKIIQEIKNKYKLK